MSLRAPSRGRTVSASKRDDEDARVAEGRLAELGGERGVGVAAHLADELGQRAAFALPAHPHALGLVEAALADEQVERAHAMLGLVALVELGDAAHRRLGDRAVVGARRLVRRSHVAEQPEGDVGVAVGEIGGLEVLDDAARALRPRTAARG